MGRQRRELPKAADDGGAAMIMLAVWLVGLLALASLALDGGLALVKRRDVRNAADHAALEAAWASCHGEDAIAAGNESVSKNGYDPAALTLTSLGGDQYRAHVRTTFTTGLAGIVGVNDFSVSGVAVADCTATAGAGGSVIWAGGDNCFDDYAKEQLTINGSALDVTGHVHSNGSAIISGSGNVFNGPPPGDSFTYAGPFDEPGSGNSYTPGHRSWNPGYMWPWDSGPPPFPLDLIDYETTADFYVDGDIDGDYVLANGDGLYYATGNIKLDKTVTMEVTLVAEGFIEFSGSDQNLTPHVHGLLAYGAIAYTGIEQCDKFGVSMSGSSNDWTGTVFAPESLIEFAGSDNTTFDGSIVGYSVRIPGSVVNLTFGGSTGSTSFSLTMTE